MRKLGITRLNWLVPKKKKEGKTLNSTERPSTYVSYTYECCDVHNYDNILFVGVYLGVSHAFLCNS